MQQQDQNYHQYEKVNDIVNPSLNSDDYQKIKDYCQTNQVRYKDQDFPPNDRSLVKPEISKDYNGQWNHIEWARADQIFGPGNYDVFRDIQPSDIRQGSLGNCYFLCALSSLAEYPSLIERLFENAEINEHGIHAVWLNINGVWQRIIVDEYFPVVQRNGKYELAFSKTDQNELWVILLEKAYAKAYGSYWEIVGGDPVHALRDLTGAPYDRIEDFDNLDEAWSQLKEANAKQFMLTCFTKQGKTVEEKGETGIVSGHAYTILDVQNVIDSRGNPRRIICIRNPWGKFEWNGDFSDDSSSWTQEDRQKLNVQRRDDGVFWIPFEDFVKYYQGIGILEIIPGAVHNGISVNQQNGGNKSIMRMVCDQDTNVTISIDQIDSRIVDNPEYSYNYFRVSLARFDEQKGLFFVDSKLSAERNIFLESYLPKGDYLILVESYWETRICQEYNIGTYSDHPVEIQLMNSNEKIYDDTEYQLWKSFARNHRDKMEQSKQREVNDGRNSAQLLTHKFQNQKFGNVIYAYENLSDQFTIHQVLSFDNLKGFDVVGQSANNRNAELLIPPRDVDVLVFKMDPRSQDGFSLSYGITNEELIHQNIKDNLRDQQLLQNLGGIQPVPGQEGKFLSRQDQQQKMDQMHQKNQQLDSQRRRKIEQRKRIIEEEKRKQDREYQQQQEYLKRHNPSGLGMLDGIFGNRNWSPQEFGGLSKNRNHSGNFQNILSMGVGLLGALTGGSKLGGMGNMMGGMMGNQGGMGKMGMMGNMMGMMGNNQGTMGKMGMMGNMMMGNQNKYGMMGNMLGNVTGNQNMGMMGNMMGNVMGGGGNPLGSLLGKTNSRGMQMVSPKNNCTIF